MKTQRNPLRWAFGLLAAACASVVLVAPPAHADPQGDATVAIDQAWTAAGGDTSPLGPRAGAVYPAGVGFGQDFVNGAIFFSPATGARSVFGAILEKYRSLGGPADSGLGFPNIDEGPGRAPESRNVTFDGADSPVIFWTPATGAWLVRGVINAAWDRVGGSSGVLGVPVEDETYSGESISQRFAGGQLTYDTAAKTFTTTPPELAGQLADLPLPDDATTAIDVAWRVAGGPGGQLGAKDGAQYPVGDGAAQNFNRGKIFFSPESGAHAVSGTILEKYEAAGGPTGELGFPTANEVDGDVPGSRVSTFGAPDAPAIVWTPEHGAVIVRSAMKAAWDKLGGSGGDLGVPVADQTGDDTITQNFSGGQVTWNSSNNTFSTQPPELAEQLTGLEVPGQTTPSPSATPSAAADAANTDDSGSGSSWYLWVIALAVLLGGSLVAWYVTKRRRDRPYQYTVPTAPAVERGYDDDDDFDEAPKFGRDDDADHDWSTTGPEKDNGIDSADTTTSDDTDYLASQPPWATREADARPWNEPAIPTGGLPVNASGPDLFTHHGSHEAEDFNADIDESDPDSVDTAPTLVQSDDDAQSGRHAAAAGESSPRWSADDDSLVPGPNSLFAPVYGAVPPPATSEPDQLDLQADHLDEAAEQDEPETFRDYSEPGYSEPGYTEPGYSEPGYPDAGYAPEGLPQPDYGQPDYARPDYLQPDYAQSDYGQPDHAQPDYPHPDSGHQEYHQATAAATPAEFDQEPAPPAIHLPLDDPDEAPEGYPVKGSMRTGTYHTPDSASFEVTVAEIWFASAELAEANGFTRAE